MLVRIIDKHSVADLVASTNSKTRSERETHQRRVQVIVISISIVDIIVVILHAPQTLLILLNQLSLLLGSSLRIQFWRLTQSSPVAPKRRRCSRILLLLVNFIDRLF